MTPALAQPDTTISSANNKTVIDKNGMESLYLRSTVCLKDSKTERTPRSTTMGMAIELKPPTTAKYLN